ncbi:MAG: hypothetical protein CL910_11780 [Deltaproteobacteria bacterium]|jgi:outer membrane protein assembly factor BamE (lipoprotein component of BamABCDE complex)|nr:hypothetical protein [Deltaproteobacteria bacterium]
MTRSRTIALITALLLAWATVGCASLGLNRSGNQFNYDNASMIKKGMSKDKVLALLEAEPRATGKSGGREHWHFEYVQNTGVGIPIPFLASAGASKGQAYTCDVYYGGSGKVVEVSYFTRQLGGESVSF